MLNEGDIVRVKLIGIDNRGRVCSAARRCSKPEGYVEPEPREREGSGDGERRRRAGSGPRPGARSRARGPRGSGRPVMRIGVPREIKTNENRVALRPAGAEILVGDGHEVWVEQSAGEGSGYADQAYEDAGARLVEGPERIFADCEMIMKVKEPLPVEVARIRDGQTVFTYFHFAASRELTEGMIVPGDRDRLRDSRGERRHAAASWFP